MNGVLARLRRAALFCALGQLLLLWSGATPAAAQLQVLPDREPQRVFSGQAHSITVLLRNAGEQSVSAQGRTRLHQASSATTILLGDSVWKPLEVPAGQTILDSAVLSFPAVKAETRFIVQWLEGTNTIIGTTEVLAYPTTLLRELKPLAGEEDLGVFDPQDQLKPLLKAVGVRYADLADEDFQNFPGKLAVVGPFQAKDQMPENLTGRVRRLAQKGAAIVWLLPPPEPREPLKPSFYTVPEGRGTVLLAEAKLVANLADDPQAQLHLVQLCRLAVHPVRHTLPASSANLNE
jgi:hypothetical protein